MSQANVILPTEDGNCSIEIEDKVLYAYNKIWGENAHVKLYNMSVENIRHLANSIKLIADEMEQTGKTS